VAELLLRPARRHVGVAVGGAARRADLGPRIGDAGPGEPPPAADTIFEIGSVTKVSTATLPATDTAAVVLSNSARSVDPLGFRMRERIGAP
jgi:hypothetical protein